MIHPRTEFKLTWISFNDLFQRSLWIIFWSIRSRMYPILNSPKECAVYISKSKHNSSQMVIKFPRVNTDEFDSRLLRLFMSRHQFENLFLASTRSFIKCHSSLERIKVRDQTRPCSFSMSSTVPLRGSLIKVKLILTWFLVPLQINLTMIWLYKMEKRPQLWIQHHLNLKVLGLLIWQIPGGGV